MNFDLDLKTVASFALGVGLVVLQAFLGYYSNGLTVLGWLGVAVTILGPAGLVALVNNSPLFNPAMKAITQAVSATAVVFFQGVIGVYQKSGGVSTADWMVIAVTVLTTIAVYIAPGTKTASSPAVVAH